jgi:hypothetical protein
MARKIFSGILVFLGALFLVLSLAGIVAAWAYNEPLTTEATSRLQEIDAELSQAQTALQDARLELERTLRIVDTAQQALSRFADQTAQAQDILGNVKGALDDDLLPGLQATREKLTDVRGTLEDLRDGLETLNSLPLVDLNLPGEEALTGLITAVDSLDSQIANVEDIGQQASTFVADSSYILGGDLSETRDNLQALLTTVEEYEQKVLDWREQVAAIISGLPGWIDTACVVLTVFLLWFAFSQFSLFLHGLEGWRGGNMLLPLQETIRSMRRPLPDTGAQADGEG